MDPIRQFPSLASGRTLSPEELRGVGEALFGSWGWQTRISEALEVDGSTVRRWVSGAVSVPGPAKVALRMLLIAKTGRPVYPPILGGPGEKKPMRGRSEK